MKILLTGATGFTGNVVLNELLKKGHEVITLCRSVPKNRIQNVVYIESDLQNIYDALSLNSSIDVILHVAASINFNTSQEHIHKIVSDNVIGTQVLANFAVDSKVSKFVLSSSCSVYEENFDSETWVNEESPIRPLNQYGVSKLASEWLAHYILKGKVGQFAVLRYSSVYGPGQRQNSILPIFIRNAQDNIPIRIFGSGNRKQDYVYVDDAAKANILCIEKQIGFGDVFNIGSGVPISDIELANNIKEAWQSKSPIEVLNADKKIETSLNYSVQKAREVLGFNAVSIKEGLKRYKELTK